MRLLVTGGSGLLGSKVAEIAHRAGHLVFSGYSQHLPPFGQPVTLDLLDFEGIEERIKEVKPEIIVHTAALTDVDRCETEKDLAFRINALGTQRLAEAARKYGAFLIYVSSDYVFDGARGRYREEDKTNPINYYGYTKLLGESYCQSFCIARTCVIYGALPARGKVNFALWLMENLRDGREVKVVTDQHITPTMNTNLAQMLLEVAERKLPGVYHLAGSTRISRYSFAVELARTFGFDEKLIIPARMEELRWKAKRPGDSSLDTSKAVRDLKARPWSLGEALKALKAEVE